MRRIIIKKILLVLLIAIFPISVNASIKCSTVTEEIDNYKRIVTEKMDVDCKDVFSVESVKMCNQYSMEKSLSLSKLFSYYYDDRIKCNNAELKKIVEENKGECTNVFGTELKDLAKIGMNFFYITAPFLLMIFGSLDFTKIVVMSDPKTIKETRKKFIKRVISFLLIFLIPVILNIILSLNSSGLDYNSVVYSCKSNIVFHVDRYEVSYASGASGGGGGTGTVVTGGITTDEQAERLNNELASMLNTKQHGYFNNTKYMYQGGPVPKWYNIPINVLEKFQCTWWANGRASQYLEEHGTKYTQYPTAYGDGGMYYGVNKSNGYFKYGSTPKPNSLISWSNGSWGHVAYVEGVASDGIYISHAGGGKAWYGVCKIGLDGGLQNMNCFGIGPLSWGGYNLNGYIYLDEPK